MAILVQRVAMIGVKERPMQPPDPRDPNTAPAEWPGETWTGQRPNENPTLPRMAPIPPPHEAPEESHTLLATNPIPPMPRYAPPPSGPFNAAPPQAAPPQAAPPPPTQVVQQGVGMQGYPVAAPPRQARVGGANSVNVNVAAIPTGAWLAVGGGVAMLLGSFLPWITVTTVKGSLSQSGWDLSAFGRVTALIGLLALALFVVRLLNVQLPVRLPWSDRNIYMALGVEALLLGLLYLVDNAHSAESVRGLSVGPAFGLYLTVLGAIALTIGAYLLGRPSFVARPTPSAR